MYHYFYNKDMKYTQICQKTSQYNEGTLKSQNNWSNLYTLLILGWKYTVEPNLFFFVLTSFLVYSCFTLLCQSLLYNKANQLYVYIYPYIPSLLHLPPTLPIPTLQVVTNHRADLPVLCGCFPLAIYFTFGSVYMSMPLSHFVPAYPTPSPCPQVHSLCLHLYSCPAPRFFRTFFFFFFFRFHIYVLAYGICFSLSDLLHSV